MIYYLKNKNDRKDIIKKGSDDHNVMNMMMLMERESDERKKR